VQEANLSITIQGDRHSVETRSRIFFEKKFRRPFSAAEAGAKPATSEFTTTYWRCKKLNIFRLGPMLRFFLNIVAEKCSVNMPFCTLNTAGQKMIIMLVFKKNAFFSPKIGEN
jgi:hypothetical protein